MVLNSKQERLRLVEFKYQKDYDWLDSKLHCSYLESRGVPGKKTTREIRVKSTGNYLPFNSGSGDVISSDATSDDVISGDVTIPTNPPQIRLELCPYTAHVLI
jgi:hypothetical protein